MKAPFPYGTDKPRTLSIFDVVKAWKASGKELTAKNVQDLADLLKDREKKDDEPKQPS